MRLKRFVFWLHLIVGAALTLRSDPSTAAEAVFGRERILFVNPYTGEILGEGSPRVRSLFRVILGIHRWLGAEGESRKVARAVTGASNIAFLFLVVSGFYLWWPRKWTWRNVRMVTWFRGGMRGRARDWNWHNVTGFWCAAPLLLIVLSGVVMSYSWANDLLFRIAGSEPARREGVRPKGVRENAPSASWDLDGLNELWARAERQMPGWRSIALKLPPSRSATFVIDQGNGGRPDKRAQLTLDRKTGAVVRWEPFASFSPGQRLRAWVRWGHTGEAAGLMGQIIAAIASAGASLLVWTGLGLGLRHFRAWRDRKPSAERLAA
jgi:uncharacterized iron-regulated membrane protein